MNQVKAKIPEICLFAPTDEMLELAERIVRQQKLDIGLYRADIADAGNKAKELLTQGAQILISRRGIARSLESFYPNHVVSVGSPLEDFIPAMEKAAMANGKVAFFNYHKTRGDVRAMCYLLHLDALFYTFRDSGECQDKVLQAQQEGAVLGIGGADSGRYAQVIGLAHQVVESSEHSILEAIGRAQQMLRIAQEERTKQMELRVRLERYEMVFNYTHDAIMAVDERGQIDVLNRRAERLIRTSQQAAIGKPLESVLPDDRIREVLSNGKMELDQLIQLNGAMVTTNRVPIVVDGQIKGVVATFQDVKALQDSEKKIRLKLHEKGLSAKYTFSDIKGESELIQSNISMARKFARANSAILIHGETGTGKELFAQSIHNASARAGGPFVAINCGSLPQNLLEAELFGYVDGAFTGARKGGKMGLFEVAHGGTIFLDEIGEMPIETQVHLLRVLQEKEIRRIGGDHVIPVDIRVVAATNRDLRKMIGEGAFRADLYYRVNVLNLEIAPLRDRKEDLREISLATFEKFLGPEHAFGTLVGELVEQMQSYDWPGNVRELHNMVERICVLLTQGEKADEVMRYVHSLLLAPDLAATPVKEKRKAVSIQPVNSFDIAAWEKQRLLQALEQNDFELGRTAKSLEIGRTTLWRRMKKYNIHESV